jgi:hydroxymethylpyrimidine pyrophosphatase-like HAD family hydrolase
LELIEKSMRYVALATDGDGTLLEDGRMLPSTIAALEKLRANKVSLLLVTGETSEELRKFPRLDLFRRVVAENGSLLLTPSTNEQTLLGKHPPCELIAALRNADVKKLKVGQGMISANTDEVPKLKEVLDRIKVDWKIIHNRRDVMLLPSGIDKASGLAAALNDLQISRHKVVAVGDAENDAPMLQYAGLGIAVADAVLVLKERADVVMSGGAGTGVAELAHYIIRNELPCPRMD